LKRICPFLTVCPSSTYIFCIKPFTFGRISTFCCPSILAVKSRYVGVLRGNFWTANFAGPCMA
jgi:hypothetical protein